MAHRCYLLARYASRGALVILIGAASTATASDVSADSAKPVTVGLSNIARMGISTLSFDCNGLTSWVLRREWRPRSKKLSWALILSMGRRKTSAQTSAMVFSVGVRGAA